MNSTLESLFFYDENEMMTLHKKMVVLFDCNRRIFFFLSFFLMFIVRIKEAKIYIFVDLQMVRIQLAQ